MRLQNPTPRSHRKKDEHSEGLRIVLSRGLCSLLLRRGCIFLTAKKTTHFDCSREQTLNTIRGNLTSMLAPSSPSCCTGLLTCFFKANRPPFERGEVTVRGLYCSHLDAALTGKPTGGGGGGSCADHGAGIAGGSTRPFYVTVTLGNVTARTSMRTGFSPSFTEVFPLGLNCPIRGAVLVLVVVDRYAQKTRSWYHGAIIEDN